jgi:outer membrane protein TolC
MFRKNAIVATVVVALCAAAAADAAEYDLNAYLSRVERDNLDLKLAKSDLEEAAQGVAQARSALLPTVAAQGGYTRNLTDAMQSTAYAADLNSPYAAAGVAPLLYQDMNTNFDNEYLGAIAVQQKLFSAQAIAQYAQAKKNREIRASAFELTRRSVLAAAKKLYAQAQLAGQVVGVMEGIERTAEETYKNAQRRFNAGVATELDLLLAESAWKTKIPSTAEARRNAEIAGLAIKTLAGIPLDEAVVLTERSDLVPPLPADRSLARVLDSRPDYAVNVLSKEIADIARKAAMASFLPTVDGSYTYAYLNYTGHPNVDSMDAKSASLGLTVSLPLFTGGYRLSLMKQAQIAQDRANINIEKKRNDIERELRSVKLRLEEAYGRIDSARTAESATRRALALAQTSFANGLATQLTVDEALTRQQQAGLGLHNALYEYRTAYYDWEITVGEGD